MPNSFFPLGPYGIFVDEKNGTNLYVSDSSNNRVVLFIAMQSVSPLPQVVVGSYCFGFGLNNLCSPFGVTVDNASNVIVTDTINNRVVLWASNATSGVQIAGFGFGNTPYSLSGPYDVFIDPKNPWFDLTDMGNARIQRFSLNDFSSYAGTTVAGGNGYGSASNQLNAPFGLWVSEKTGNIYISEQLNNRIQLWKPNATECVTVAGTRQGLSSSNATMLSHPVGIVVNANETFMYVSDANNSRIQKFQLI
jgi:DNA-binding beta-propeller fold protein YncE